MSSNEIYTRTSRSRCVVAHRATTVPRQKHGTLVPRGSFELSTRFWLRSAASASTVGRSRRRLSLAEKDESPSGRPCQVPGEEPGGGWRPPLGIRRWPPADRNIYRCCWRVVCRCPKAPSRRPRPAQHSLVSNVPTGAVTSPMCGGQLPHTVVSPLSHDPQQASKAAAVEGLDKPLLKTRPQHFVGSVVRVFRDGAGSRARRSRGVAAGAAQIRRTHPAAHAARALHSFRRDQFEREVHQQASSDHRLMPFLSQTQQAELVKEASRTFS